jgi:hypothetical protein
MLSPILQETIRHAVRDETDSCLLKFFHPLEVVTEKYSLKINSPFVSVLNFNVMYIKNKAKSIVETRFHIKLGFALPSEKAIPSETILLTIECPKEEPLTNHYGLGMGVFKTVDDCGGPIILELSCCKSNAEAHKMMRTIILKKTPIECTGCASFEIVL